MNPPNNIQNGFFTQVSHFFSKIRKLTVFFRATLTPRLYYNLSVCGWGADGSFVPKNRRSCHFPAARPVQPARNFPETKKIICPTHAAHVGHMIGDLVQSFPAPPDLPPRGRGTARRRWKEFVPLTRLRKTGESSSADDGTRSARPRGLGGNFDLPRSKVATGLLPFAWDAPPR